MSCGEAANIAAQWAGSHRQAYSTRLRQVGRRAPQGRAIEVAVDEVAPRGVDVTKPSIARVYDFMVGGKDNFAVDRMAAHAALAIVPDAQEAGRACRAF